MNTIQRVTEIVKVEPFKLVVRWTNGSVRVIDFEELLAQWQVDESDPAYSLMDPAIFKQVRISEDKTVEWPVLIEHLAFEGDKAITRRSPLTFDPVVLYDASHAIDEYRLVPIS